MMFHEPSLRVSFHGGLGFRYWADGKLVDRREAAHFLRSLGWRGVEVALVLREAEKAARRRSRNTAQKPPEPF